MKMFVVVQDLISKNIYNYILEEGTNVYEHIARMNHAYIDTQINIELTIIKFWEVPDYDIRNVDNVNGRLYLKVR